MTRQSNFTVLLAALALCGGANATQADAAKPGDYGDSKANAIEVCKPAGQREYLSRLMCSDSTRPTFLRIGSLGPRYDPPENMSSEQKEAMVSSITTGRALKEGELDHHIIDGYEVSCGAVKRVIFMDMYHCQSAPPDRAPKGLTLLDRN